MVEKDKDYSIKNIKFKVQFSKTLLPLLVAKGFREGAGICFNGTLSPIDFPGELKNTLFDVVKDEFKPNTIATVQTRPGSTKELVNSLTSDNP